jgi:hypothetical protein
MTPAEGFSSSTPTRTRNGNRRPELELPMRDLSPCIFSAIALAHFVSSLCVCVASEAHEATTVAPGKEVDMCNATLNFRKLTSPSSAFTRHQSSFHTQCTFANTTPQRVDRALSAAPRVRKDHSVGLLHTINKLTHGSDNR